MNTLDELRGGLPSSCAFCGIPKGERLHANWAGVAFLDRFPLCEGHALVVPHSHVESIFDLEEGTRSAIWELVASVRRLLNERFSPDGYNIGVNDGEPAGQTIAHAHIHLIPRYANDVPDPRGGIRWVIPNRARYWEE